MNMTLVPYLVISPMLKSSTYFLFSTNYIIAVYLAKQGT
jgi:hypothetical protein